LTIRRAGKALELAPDYIQCMHELSGIVHVMNTRSPKSAAADDADSGLRRGVVIQDLPWALSGVWPWLWSGLRCAHWRGV
jgi:hypothetical protein